MYKGFYNLTSGMLSQQRLLNTISNNMANASTPGFKRDIMATSTFRDVLVERTGNIDKSNPFSLNGEESMIRTVQELVTNHSQASIGQTGGVFDFGIEGPGFFTIAAEDAPLYTRNGAFTLDDEGYLYLDKAGRVMGADGPILVGTDAISVDPSGNIYNELGELLGQIAIADFEDYTTLTKFGEGLFTSTTQPSAQNPEMTTLAWKSLEQSNVSMMDEMVAMMTSQRALQSAAQVLRMHDSINGRAVSEIGKV